MPQSERERLLGRIAELQAALRSARSPDLRSTLRQAIADCEEKLASIETQSLRLPAETTA